MGLGLVLKTELALWVGPHLQGTKCQSKRCNGLMTLHTNRSVRPTTARSMCHTCLHRAAPPSNSVTPWMSMAPAPWWERSWVPAWVPWWARVGDLVQKWEWVAMGLG